MNNFLTINLTTMRKCLERYKPLKLTQEKRDNLTTLISIKVIESIVKIFAKKKSPFSLVNFTKHLRKKTILILYELFHIESMRHKGILSGSFYVDNNPIYQNQIYDKKRKPQSNIPNGQICKILNQISK